MKRSLLTPRWLLLHAVFLAAFIATGFLAWWQWDRAHAAGGSFQNLGYALQWPLFGAFAVFLWYRVARMYLQEVRASAAFGADGVEGVQASPDPTADTTNPAETSPAQTTGGRAGSGQARTSGSIDPEEAVAVNRRRLVPPSAAPVDPQEDPELAAYNRYLAELNAE